MKWNPPPRDCPSRNYYRDSACGRWRITWDDTGKHALMDRRDGYRVVCVGTKDECKTEAERDESN